MTDVNGRGGVHGGRNLYCQKDLTYGTVGAVPTAKQDDEQTLAAFMHLLGDLPRRSYYSDNQKCLKHIARRC